MHDNDDSTRFTIRDDPQAHDFPDPQYPHGAQVKWGDPHERVSVPDTDND